MTFSRLSPRVAAVAAALALGVAALAPTASAAPAAEQQPSPAEKGQMQLRELLRLPADTATVRDRGSRTDTVLNYGIPMTRDEVETVSRHDAASEVAGQLASGWRTSESTFAGQWTDDDGIFHFAFTDEPSAAARRDLARMPSSARYSIERFPNALARLLSVQERVVNAQQNLRAQGVTVTGTALIESDNVLEIYVTREPEGAKEKIAKEVEASSGELRVVTDRGSEEQINRDRRSGSLYGGLFAHAENVGNCTVGFSFLRSNSDTNTFMTTAGHCGPTGRNFIMGTGTSPVIAPIHNNALRGPSSPSKCDCLIVGAIPGAQITDDVLVDNDARFDYTILSNTGSFGQGNVVYVSGAGTFTSGLGRIISGKIISSSVTDTSSNGTPLSDLVMVDTGQTIGGDSGAPWGMGGTWMGVHRGLKDGRSIFSKSYNVLAFNVTARFDSPN